MIGCSTFFVLVLVLVLVIVIDSSLSPAPDKTDRMDALDLELP
jgi:hypothetical protein